MSEHGEYSFLTIKKKENVKGVHKAIWGKKTVFYDFLKNATFRVKSEAINRFNG